MVFIGTGFKNGLDFCSRLAQLQVLCLATEN